LFEKSQDKDTIESIDTETHKVSRNSASGTCSCSFETVI